MPVAIHSVAFGDQRFPKAKAKKSRGSLAAPGDSFMMTV